MFRRSFAQQRQEARAAWDRTGTAHHRFDNDSREVLGVPLDLFTCSCAVVILTDNGWERHVNWRDFLRVFENASVIRAFECQDRLAPGDCARGSERHQIGFSTRVAEPDELA